jgi:hypothetical protein
LDERRGAAVREVLALVLAWSREEPGRAGEVALIDGEQILGRGGPRVEDALPRAQFQQQRPGNSTPMGRSTAFASRARSAP